MLGKDVDKGSEVKSTGFCDGARGGDGADVLDDGCQEGGGLASLRKLELCCDDGDCSICCNRVNQELVKLEEICMVSEIREGIPAASCTMCISKGKYSPLTVCSLGEWKWNCLSSKLLFRCQSVLVY